MNICKNFRFLLGIAVFLHLQLMSALVQGQTTKYQFNISFSENLTDEAQNGRLLLLLSNDAESEPRFQIADGPETQLVYGINVNNWKSNSPAQIDTAAFGYPITEISNIPSGKYYVQALLNRYETFNLEDGRTLELPPDKGEGQQWNRKPGNFYSEPQKIQISDESDSFSIQMNKEIPPVKPLEDSKFIKHLEIRSEKLSKFWGRDMYLGAHVLLPKGFEEHPEAKYPLMVFHGHFPSDFEGFRTSPPDSSLLSNSVNDSENYRYKSQKSAYEFYKTWTSEDFPRYIIIKIQHPTPYYDDSYAVNSANQGPYGDAITYELIPHIEKKYRGLGEEWSRYLYGGSTGGWEALAVQIKYPEEYGGTFSACPDGVDFRAHQILDIYNKDNAYYVKSDFKKTFRPGFRDSLGRISSTMEDQNHRELALGTNTRSGQQWDAWEATYSPVGSDGYPARLWDRRTGKINHDVAEYWKKNYDLRYILERDWNRELGEKLQGKIHIYTGDMDNYYLNNGVYYMEDFLESTKDPYYEGEIVYGDRQEHCWNGPPSGPQNNHNYNTKYLPEIMELIKSQAPEGADLTSWRY